MRRPGVRRSQQLLLLGGCGQSDVDWLDIYSIYSIYSIYNIYLQAGEEPGAALHHGGRAGHLDLQQPQAEELCIHALETSAQLKIVIAFN